MGNPKWDFIHRLVEGVADLPEPSDEPETTKRQRKRKEAAVDENGVVIKKSAAKRTGGPKKSRRKQASSEEDDYVPEGGDVGMEVSEPAGEVFVDVSLVPATQSAPSAPTMVDEDDFDA